LLPASGRVLDLSLGGRIGEQYGIWHDRVNGGGIDDGAAWLHVRHGGLRQIEHRVDVGLESPLPFHIGHVVNILERCLPGRVIDQDVDAAEFVDRWNAA